MKKIIFGIALICAAFMVSCGKHKTEVPVEDTVTVEEVVVNDSVVCDSAEEVPCDSTEVAE